MVNPPLSLRELQDKTYQTNVTSKRLVADLPCASSPQTECFEHVDVNLSQPFVGDEVSNDIQPVSIPLDFSFVARSDGQERLLVMDQKRCRSGRKRATPDRNSLLDTLSQIEEPLFGGFFGIGQVWCPSRFLDEMILDR